MPTYRDLPQAPTEPPRFTMTLDGEFHILSVTWNVSAQRWYFNLYDSFGTWIVTAPLIATAPGRRISEMFYDQRLRSVVVRLHEPHWRPLGQIVDWTLEGVDPERLNGLHRCETTGESEFIFYVADNPLIGVNPGQMALHGTAHRYANLVKGYIENDTLIFRDNKFEVTNGRQFSQGAALFDARAA